MKRDASIDATLTLPGVTRPVGRPRKPDALTNAEVCRRYRRKHGNVISLSQQENSSVVLDAVLRILRESDGRNKFLPQLFGALRLRAAGGDALALEVCKGIARLLDRPDWLDELKADYEVAK
jgi:hypothetical protein